MFSAEMPLKNDDRLTIRLPGDLLATLEEIQSKHGLNATEIARRCLEQVADFYRKHGYFAFPVKLLPEKEFLAAVMKTTEAAELQEMAEKSQKPKPRKAG